jgi:3-hydroxyisobutyrate dehydrogenase-like beta-hydroxyacid dehydrogenase
MSAVKRSLNVGVIGMGRMGVPITRNLAFKSRSALYLQIHSRSLARAKHVSNDLAMDGAQCAMRLHDKYSTMTKWCDVVLSVLADVPSSRHAMLECTDALLPNAREGQIIVDHTTLDVETAKEYHEVARKRGAVFLDVPMSGSPQSALNGQLTLMAGGPEDSFLKVLPLFRMYAETIHRMGHAGSGSSTKGIISMLVGIHSLAAAEALTMAHATGIDDSTNLIKVLDASWGSSTMLRRNASTIQRMLRNPEEPPPISSTTINTVLHDAGMLGRGAGLDGSEIDGACYPLFHHSCNVMARAAVAGVGDRDIAGVVHFLDAANTTTPPQERAESEDSHEPQHPSNDRLQQQPVSRKAFADVSDEVDFY